jgi:hypothetical protein
VPHFDKGKRTTTWTEEGLLILVGFSGAGLPLRAWVVNTDALVGAFRRDGTEGKLIILDADADGHWGTPGDLWAVALGSRAFQPRDLVARDRPSGGFSLGPLPMDARHARLERVAEQALAGQGAHAATESLHASDETEDERRATSKSRLTPDCSMKAERWVAALLCEVEKCVATEEHLGSACQFWPEERGPSGARGAPSGAAAQAVPAVPR